MTNQEAIRILNEQRNKFMDEWVDFGGVNEAYDMAIALLKEQEPIKPKSKVRHGENGQIQHWCGNCMAMLHGKPKYCSNCGRQVKWE